MAMFLRLVACVITHLLGDFFEMIMMVLTSEHTSQVTVSLVTQKVTLFSGTLGKPAGSLLASQ